MAENYVERTMEIQSEISMAMGEAKILLLDNKLISAAERMEIMAAAYLKFADMLRRRNEELPNGNSTSRSE